MPTIYAYGRQSTAYQDSLESQEEICRKWIEYKLHTNPEYKYGGFYGDVISATRNNHGIFSREMLSNLYAVAKAGDIIVVSAHDRMCRQIRELEDFRDWIETRNVQYVALDINLDTSTPSGQMILRVVTAMKTYENKEFERRTEAGKVIRRAHGLPKHEPPGWIKVTKDKWSPDEHMRKIGRICLNEVMTTTHTHYDYLAYVRDMPEVKQALVECNQERVALGVTNKQFRTRDAVIFNAACAAANFPLMPRTNFVEYFFPDSRLRKPQLSPIEVRKYYNMVREGTHPNYDPDINQEILRRIGEYRTRKQVKKTAITLAGHAMT